MHVNEEEGKKLGETNMAGRWRNGSHRNGGNGGRDQAHDEIRKACENCDHRIDSLEKFSDDLRLGQVQREEQIRGLRYDMDAIKKEMDAHIAEYRADKTAQSLEVANLRAATDAIKIDISDRLNQVRADATLALTNARTELTLSLDHGLRALDKKFDDNRQYFTRYFIIMLVTILTGLIVGGAVFMLNR